VLSTSDFDVMQFGIDPTFVIGGAFIGSALIGWLVGPAFGNAAFNLRFRAIRGQIAQVSSCCDSGDVVGLKGRWLTDV
jgi:hypothetical protein